MSTINRPKHEIVLRYLTQGEGERKIKLYHDHGIEFGMYNNRLHHILWDTGKGEEMWCVSDMSLNEFIKNCELMTDEDVIGMLGSVVLTSSKRNRERES